MYIYYTFKKKTYLSEGPMYFIKVFISHSRVLLNSEVDKKQSIGFNRNNKQLQ